MTTTTQVQIFVGEEITYGSERNFLARLRADLVRRGCAARIHANFITRRNQRQVDFLIATDHRLVQVELKTVDQTLPLIGGVNGPWAQELLGGQLRTLDRNFYRQAHDATFAVSDDMHDLARRGEVPGIAGKYFAQLHTVVCVNPDIPAGSRLDRYQHVDVVGYQQLLTLLTSDGPKPAWENEHWDAFTRHLQLIPQQPDDPEETSRRDIVALLSDYRRRFTATVERDLHEYVPLPAQTTEATAADPVLVLAEAMAGRRVATFTGPSGAGKSHAARHAALTLAASDGIPVWVRCGEYHRGRFSHALSRAVAPFTTDSGVALLRQAAQAGSPAAVILDGLNECAPADQAELLEQFDALRLRLPVAAVITSTTSIGLPNPDVELTALSPGDDTRAALLASYGHPDGLDGAEAFQTPMELALAAQCSDQVRHGATATELFDAYIGHACPAETTRAGLRRLAVEMDRQLRGSLTITEIRALLHRHADASTPAAGIDAVLNCSLLTLTQGRAAFTHERFARFLAAEHLVLHAGDTTALVAALRAFGHGDLPAHAIALETRANHRRELLLALADPPLLTAAVQGRFGSQTAAAIETEVVTSLDEATNATTEAQPIRDVGGPDDHFDFHWEMPTPRTGLQQALLIVAGRSLADGLFLHETARLLDATDHRCAQRMRQLREGGHRAAISAVVHATYSGISYSGDRELRKLAASVVINACELSHLPRRRRVVKPSPARAMWGDVTEPRPRWGRLTATLFLLHPDDPDDHALLPDVFIAAWAANGSILRFTALRTAMENARAAKGAVRDRMRAALDQCDTENIFLNSSLFEALAAYGGIDPLNTEDTIRARKSRRSSQHPTTRTRGAPLAVSWAWSSRIKTFTAPTPRCSPPWIPPTICACTSWPPEAATSTPTPPGS